MEIGIIYIGDIVGHPGRDAVAELLPELKQHFQPDLVLANCENATHGRGFSRKHYDELVAAGVDAFSSGDHIWHSSDDFINELSRPEMQVVRPANYPKAPGKTFLDITVKGKRLRLINLIGRVFTGANNVDSPFATFDKIVAEYPEPDVVVVDFHAEATSEKRALAEYLDGRAHLVVGTHTHVPTADAQILAQGTAFISDLGMTGPQDSSLGAEKTEVIKNFLTGLPWRYNVGAGQCELGAIFCRIDLAEKRAVHIEHIRRFTRHHA